MLALGGHTPNSETIIRLQSLLRRHPYSTLVLRRRIGCSRSVIVPGTRKRIQAQAAAVKLKAAAMKAAAEKAAVEKAAAEKAAAEAKAAAVKAKAAAVKAAAEKEGGGRGVCNLAAQFGMVCPDLRPSNWREVRPGFTPYLETTFKGRECHLTLHTSIHAVSSAEFPFDSCYTVVRNLCRSAKMN